MADESLGFFGMGGYGGFGLSPMYMVITFGLLILSLVAQGWIKAAFSKWSRVRNTRNMSGAEAARTMLESEGVYDVDIRRFEGGMLSDHFDPGGKVINLSPDVYDGRSVASVGVACHEAGHALQHAQDYAPLKLRSMLVGPTQLGSKFSIPLIFIGLLLGFLGLVKIGIVLFAVTFFFQVVTLPVEINASRRSRQALIAHGIVAPGMETQGVTSVLSAAAFTYIAAAVSSLVMLLYYVSLLNRRSNN